ncbi:MAG: tetratricopeptide repeat protein, partial [Clostridia bacterium]|nr:tetratricopeptide repeat protein [Clostridia bacterium]
IIDEGLTLIPLEAEEPEESSEEPEEQVDTGIYLVDDYSADAAVPSAAPSPASRKKSSKSGKGGKKSRPRDYATPPRSEFERLSPEQKFRLAMHNIDPQLRASVKHDPIQRAALEQAVRIALVQQAAHEAVERTSGKPVFGTTGFSASDVKRANQQRHPSRGDQSSQRRRPPSDTLVGGYSSTPAEFQTSDTMSLQDFASMFSPVTLPAEPPAPSPAVSPAGAPMDTNTFGAPRDTQHDIPVVTNTPAASSDSTTKESKQVYFNSPAAIRASLRDGESSSISSTSPNASSARPVHPRYGSLQREDENATRSGCMVWLIALFILFFIGIIAVAIIPSLSKEFDYRHASSQLTDGEYLDAAESFEELDEYKDSRTRMYECYYAYADTLKQSGDYSGALDYLLPIETDYPPATESIADCRYNIGKAYLDAGEYANAYNQLYLISRYLDAGDLAMQANYLCAAEAEQAGDYETARTRYSMYPDYLDSLTRWHQCQYECAAQLYKEDNYASAYELFIGIKEYKDAFFQAAMSQYNSLSDSFTLNYSQREIYDCLGELGKYSHMDVVADAIKNEAYTGAKLIGKWSDGTNTIEYDFTDGGTLLTINFADYVGGTVYIDNVLFNGTVLYNVIGGEEGQTYIRITEYDSNISARPQTMTVYSFLTARFYTLTRVE